MLRLLGTDWTDFDRGKANVAREQSHQAVHLPTTLFQNFSQADIVQLDSSRGIEIKALTGLIEVAPETATQLAVEECSGLAYPQAEQLIPLALAVQTRLQQRSCNHAGLLFDAIDTTGGL